MGRQLFLHHYLPAHVASALVTGALVEFVFNIEPQAIEEVVAAAGGDGKTKKKAPQTRTSRPVRERIAGQSMLASWAATGVIIAVLLYGYIFFSPLTYGQPGLDVAGVNARKWLGYDLHFAK